MRLSTALAPIQDLLTAIRVASLPTFLAIVKSPLLLFRPHEVSRIFMNHVWSLFGPDIDGNSAELKQTLITPNVQGVVLDIGAGERSFFILPSRALAPKALSHC